MPLLKFEDRDYDQGQDDDGGRVGADFEEADVDPKVGMDQGARISM